MAGTGTCSKATILDPSRRSIRRGTSSPLGGRSVTSPSLSLEPSTTGKRESDEFLQAAIEYKCSWEGIYSRLNP
jgi:hypothetical protein